MWYQLRSSLQQVVEESAEILKAFVRRHSSCVEAADVLSLLFDPSGYAEVVYLSVPSFGPIGQNLLLL